MLKSIYNSLKEFRQKDYKAYSHAKSKNLLEIVCKKFGWEYSHFDGVYLSFEEARAFSHALKLKSRNQWVNYSKSSKRPRNIPAAPNMFYKNEGWISWGDWTGNGLKSPQEVRDCFLPFEEAINFTRSLGLKSWSDWREFSKSKNKPSNIPANPESAYKNNGWISMNDWLGIKIGFDGTYLPFEEARAFIHTINLKSQRYWSDYSKSDKKPYNIPKAPHKTYKNEGWISYGDWLGTGTIAPHKRKYRPFKEARDFVRKLNLKSQLDWSNYYKSDKRPSDIPSAPSQTYKDEGWVSLGDWIGTRPGFDGTFLPFEEARAFVRNLKFINENQWREFCRSKNKPYKIPANPNTIYKDEGWISWPDWIGTRPGFDGTFLPFEDARAFVRTLNLKNKNEWEKYYKSDKKPYNIPSNPRSVYKNEGWNSLSDWIGTRPGFDGTFLPFEEARAFVRNLKFINETQWREYHKFGNRPYNIPSAPNVIYKDKGWISWPDWFGTRPGFDGVFLPFEEARAFVRTLCLKTTIEWNKYCKSGKKPHNIPNNPRGVYKNEGWISWPDWTGTKPEFDGTFLPFEDARAFVRALGLKKTIEWNKYCKSGKKPHNIPNNPRSVYKNEGWISLCDFLINK